MRSYSMGEIDICVWYYSPVSLVIDASLCYIQYEKNAM